MARSALVVIDMLNPYEHRDAEHLARQVATITGPLARMVATEQCVLYSALDAYVRHYALTVPPDCVAAIHEDLGRAALRMMERNMSAHLTLSGDCFR